MEDLPAYTPQALSDIPPLYRPQDSDSHIRVYNLRQTSSGIQNLSLRTEHAAPDVSYEIKVNKTGGFMNRKPHVVISASHKDHWTVEGRYDIHGTGTTISYPHLETQRLELESSVTQTLRTHIHGSDMWWQPHPGNKGVLELTNAMDEIVARFTYAAQVSQRTGSWSESAESASDTKKDKAEVNIGELHVVESLAGEDSGLEQVLCSAILVVERAKRRATYMAKSGAPLKGPASWGWGQSLMA